jgi:hypothetical protein
MSFSVNNESKELDKGIVFWALMGPLCVLLTIALGVFNSFPGISLIAFAAFLGLLLCYKLKNKGLILSFVVLLVSFLLSAFLSKGVVELWQMGLVISLMLSLTVCNYCLSESSLLFGTALNHFYEKDRDIENLKVKFSQIQNEWEHDKSLLFEKLQIKQNEFLNLKSQLRDRERKITYYEEKISVIKNNYKENRSNVLLQEDKAQHQLQKLQQENSALQGLLSQLKSEKENYEKSILILNDEIIKFKKVNEVTIAENSILMDSIVQLNLECASQAEWHIRSQEEISSLLSDFHEQKAVINESFVHEKALLSKKYEEEKAKSMSLQQDLQALKREYSSLSVADIRKYEILFKQLKKQFDEKNHVLEDARRQLFKTDNELSIHQMIQNIEKASNDPMIQKILKDIDLLVQENQYLEEENKALEEIISSLFVKA